MNDSSRLKRLREHLGLNQRQMAAEFGVTHGAIGLWEAGDRPLLGPMVRLIELYEEESGLPVCTPKVEDELEEILASRFARQVSLSKFSAKIFGLWLGNVIKSLVSSQSEASTLRKSVHIKLANKLAKELGQMKGLPMKIGQMLGYLAFAMPEEARETLSSLQTSSTPLAPRKVARLIKDELGAEPDKIFAKWIKNPIAMASIGQVHLARLKSGQLVAVKVQYPGIAKAIEADLKMLSSLIPITKLLFREKEPGSLQQEFSECFLQECDYQLEADNQEYFRKVHFTERDIVVPRVFREFSTSRILCSEFFKGVQLAEFARTASQEQRDRAGHLILQFTWESILKHHVFNADPHPGNYLFHEGKVVFLDYGCVRRFSPQFIRNWKMTFQGTLEQNIEKVVIGLQGIGLIDSNNLDLDHIRRLMECCYDPCLRGGPYLFHEDWIKKSFRVWFLENPNKAKMTFAREWIFLTRVLWGMGAVLAQIGVRSHFRDFLVPLLYDNSELIPPDLSRGSGSTRLAHTVAKTAKY